MHARQKGATPATFAGIIAAVLLVMFSALPLHAQDTAWPRRMPTPEGTVTLYQPQLESLKGDTVTARSAVSFTAKTGEAPVFGAVWFSARVVTDRNTRLVSFRDIKVTDAKFPDATPEKVARLGRLLETEAPKWPVSMTHDHLLAMAAAVKEEQAGAEGLKNTPPTIIFSRVPAILVVLDGDPQLLRVKDSPFMRVVNTPFFMLFDPTSNLSYLRTGAGWYTSGDVRGPWKPEPAPPAGAVTVADRDAGPLPQDGTPPAKGPAPKIIVATTPTELIVTDGEPRYTPLRDTGLLAVSNTTGDVFMEIGSQRYFVLLSGRWFTSLSLDGPWEYLPPEKLAAGFARIAPDSASARVRPSVPGTPEAREAIVEAQIPQTAAVQPGPAPDIKVEYDGEPKFRPIEGTGMEFGVNTASSVIREEGRYYLCRDAIWYISSSPNGPWAVSTSPPREIARIPPNSPVYNTKFVTVYEATPEAIYVGYTPGYAGAYVSGGTVVYGTGYVYPGWVGTVYYPQPITYGFAPVYEPVYGAWAPTVSAGLLGFGMGMIAGAAIAGSWDHWWGPCGWHGGDVNINRNININNVNINNNRWNNNIYARNNVANHLTPAERDRMAQSAANRPGTATRPGQKPAQPPVAKGGENRGQHPPTAQSRSKQADRVYSDKQGNVYRKQGNTWQQRTSQGWKQPENAQAKPQARTQQAAQPRTPSAPNQNASRSRPDLDQQYQARQRGQERSNTFDRSGGSGGGERSFSRGSGGGGRGRR